VLIQQDVCMGSIQFGPVMELRERARQADAGETVIA